MSFKQCIISGVSKFQGNHFLQNFPLDCCIPVYHTVSEEYLPHLQHIINYKNPKDFRKDLEFLAKNFQFLDWDDFKKFKEGKKKFNRKTALLTFDDGLREFYDVVLPVLEEMGIFAMNFINPKFIDNQELMFRCKASLLLEKLNKSEKINPEIFNILPTKNQSKKEIKNQILSINYQNRNKIETLAKILELDFESFLKIQKPYLSLEQLREIQKKGFRISNHGYDHPLYEHLNLQQKIQNTIHAKDFLKLNDFQTDSFAFPFSDFGVEKDFFDFMNQETDFFCTFGAAGIKRDSVKNNYQRILMENLKSAEQNLKEQISYYQLKKIFNKNTVKRK